MKKLYCILILLNFGVINSASSREVGSPYLEYSYVIQSGDEIGSLLYSMGFSPLWGRDGFVQKIIELNQGIVQKNGDLYFPTDELILPTRPFYLCNVRIQEGNVRVITKVRTRTQYNELLKKFNANCKQRHRDERLSYSKRNHKRQLASTNELVSEENELKKHEFKRFGRMKVMPRAVFSKIAGVDKATNVKGEIYSAVNTGVTLAWEQVWSRDFESSFYADIENHSYEENPGRILEKSKKTTFNIGIETLNRFSKSIFLRDVLV